jgi:hypothetical protein
MQASNPGGSWFEIQNISSDTISLKNYKYLSHSGKLQAFAQDTLNPGEIMVLSNDTQAFYQWYGRSNKVRTGVFQLNDSFGTLQIYNEKNMPVQAVIYEISGGWPHQTNYSIELLADTGNPCQSSSWQLRCRYGLPGKDRNTICVNTGLGSEEDSNRIRIYPNPTEDVIYIDGAETTDIVTITDITGKPIKTETLRQGSLDFKELPSGVYIIKIQHRNFKVLRP